MSRVRVSTTVDGGQLERARRLGLGSDAVLLDRALAALLEHHEAERERLALALHPYAEDADLDLGDADARAWDALPYEGSAPPDVVRLALARRAARRA
jgi:hypothetical protein